MLEPGLVVLTTVPPLMPHSRSKQFVKNRVPEPKCQTMGLSSVRFSPDAHHVM